MREPSVICIVLNWNGWRDTVVCIDALLKSDYSNLSIIVVDNASTDDSVVHIRGRYPNIQVVDSGSNLGFGGGNNVGMRIALKRQPDYLWLVNNDATPKATALSELVRKAESFPNTGAVGSLLLYAHDPSVVQAWGGGRVNSWFGLVRHAVSPKPDSWFDYVTAASVLLRRQALQDVGLFDEGFFLYWEDADLGVRLVNVGWKLAIAPESIVLHKEGASTKRNYNVIDRYSTASGLRFLTKHARYPSLSVSLFLSGRLLKRLVFCQFERVKHVVLGVKDWRSYRRLS